MQIESKQACKYNSHCVFDQNVFGIRNSPSPLPPQPSWAALRAGFLVSVITSWEISRRCTVKPGMKAIVPFALSQTEAPLHRLTQDKGYCTVRHTQLEGAIHCSTRDKGYCTIRPKPSRSTASSSNSGKRLLYRSPYLIRSINSSFNP